MNNVTFEKMRIEAGKSQQEVAVSMGLSLTAYRNKEKGRSRFYADEISKFSEAIGKKTDEVLKQFFLE